jgi:hypothetical protein
MRRQVQPGRVAAGQRIVKAIDNRQPCLLRGVVNVGDRCPQCRKVAGYFNGVHRISQPFDVARFSFKSP